MSRKRKQTDSERIEVGRACAEERMSATEAAQRMGVAKATMQEWTIQYKENGPLALRSQEKNNIYSPEIRDRAIEDYLSGKGSQREIAAKYGIRSAKQLRDWIKVYNSGRDFEQKMSGGSRMKQGRETTPEERIAIVKESLENGNNYGERAIKFSVSYQQVYSWVKKYKEQGDAGLEDRRGKRVAEQAPRTELEELKIKMAQLEHKNYMLRMERDLIKKLDELERRDAFHK